MAARTARAFSPAGISSFFEICDVNADGKFISDPKKIGSRGGGFAIEMGVLTEVSIVESRKHRIQIFINGKPAPEAKTTRTVVEMLLEKSLDAYNVTVSHEVAVPIGAGFGTSAGGALGTALALSKLLEINLTMLQIGQIAHIAEVRNYTGLGTVGPLTLGGCCITVEPGALGYSLIDRLPISPSHRIITGFHKPILTKEVLSSPEMRRQVNIAGRQTLDRILADPSLQNFLSSSKEFAIKTGFASRKVLKLFEIAEKAGAIGVAQNMVGEAVHSLTTVEKAQRIVEAFKRVLPPKNILMARIDFQGARLLG